MKYARCRFALVHHDGFLYAVGGTQEKSTTTLIEDHLIQLGLLQLDPQQEPDETRYLNTAERFNLATQEWDKVYTLPMPLTHTCAVVVEGKILVYGLKEQVDEECEYWLIGFDPISQKWTKFVQEKYTVKGYKAPRSALVVHDGTCYRVKYEHVPKPTERYPGKSIQLPHVNQINLKMVRSGRGGFRASIGNSVEGQETDVVHEYWTQGTFHIKGSIYINVCGYPHKTGAVLGDPDSGLSDLNGWKYCHSINKKCVVEYVVDTRKIF